MNDDEPTYLSTADWVALLDQLNVDDALRQRLGVKLCPFSGAVEEHTALDQLGGMLNIWPMKFRVLIEAGREDMAREAA